MKKTSRKRLLESRSARYGNKYRAATYMEKLRTAVGFFDGYKAAMRDLRKLVKECYADAAVHADPEKRIKMRNHCVRVRIERFLRPLR